MSTPIVDVSPAHGQWEDSPINQATREGGDDKPADEPGAASKAQPRSERHDDSSSSSPETGYPRSESDRMQVIPDVKPVTYPGDNTPPEDQGFQEDKQTVPHAISELKGDDMKTVEHQIAVNQEIEVARSSIENEPKSKKKERQEAVFSNLPEYKIRPAGTRNLPLGMMEFGGGVSEELEAELAAGPPENNPPHKPSRGDTDSEEERD